MKASVASRIISETQEGELDADFGNSFAEGKESGPQEVQGTPATKAGSSLPGMEPNAEVAKQQAGAESAQLGRPAPPARRGEPLWRTSGRLMSTPSP